MHRKKARFLKVVFLTLIMSPLAFPNAILRAKGNNVGWQIDVYTQKWPFNGIGPGKPSDAFEPYETCDLYALVTYNAYPVQSLLVSFEVNGPPNPLENITLSLTGLTNGTGVANTNFTIPWPNENPETKTFGVWTVVASAKNASDSLSFNVGWIVELASLSVVNRDPPQGGFLGVNLTVRNISMTPKNATFAFVIIDSLNQIISTTIIQNPHVAVGETNYSSTIRIPRQAAVGIGRINVSVYSPGGAHTVPLYPQLFG
jgi:hypothetical protein